MKTLSIERVTRRRLVQRDWTPRQRRFRRQLATITTASTALLWLDNLSEHYRGGFQRKLMYAPIAVNPVVVATGALTSVTDGSRGRQAFEALSVAQTVVAVIGFVEHQRGILKRPGFGARNYLFHAWYGPPVAAPLQYLGLGLMGVMATVPYAVALPVMRRVPPARLMRAFIALNIPPLWAEVGYLHARGSFQNPAQWLPVVTLPVSGVVAAVAATSDSPAARAAGNAAAVWITLLGVVGTAFHLLGVHRRYGGYDRRSVLFNWLNGPPVPAPLQIVGLGLAGLAAERMEAKR